MRTNKQIDEHHPLNEMKDDVPQSLIYVDKENSKSEDEKINLSYEMIIQKQSIDEEIEKEEIEKIKILEELNKKKDIENIVIKQELINNEDITKDKIRDKCNDDFLNLNLDRSVESKVSINEEPKNEGEICDDIAVSENLDAESGHSLEVLPTISNSPMIDGDQKADHEIGASLESNCDAGTDTLKDYNSTDSKDNDYSNG